MHEDAEEQFDTQLSGVALAPWYQPAGTNGSPVPLLKGRPVYAVEQCSPLGTAGDIILADLDHYIVIDGGLRPALSADVLFDDDELVWRFVLRVDGRSAFASAITPYAGSTTRSPFITLGNR